MESLSRWRFDLFRQFVDQHRFGTGQVFRLEADRAAAPFERNLPDPLPVHTAGVEFEAGGSFQGDRRLSLFQGSRTAEP